MHGVALTPKLLQDRLADELQGLPLVAVIPERALPLLALSQKPSEELIKSPTLM